jgi:hypothetical protein
MTGAEVSVSAESSAERRLETQRQAKNLTPQLLYTQQLHL